MILLLKLNDILKGQSSLNKKRKRSKLTPVESVLASSKFKELLDKKKYVKHEYQDFGVRIAIKLSDFNHKSLYIKLARDEDRHLLEKAYRFAVDYPKMEGKNRGRLFMWKLKQLREEKKKPLPQEKNKKMKT